MYKKVSALFWMLACLVFLSLSSKDSQAQELPQGLLIPSGSVSIIFETSPENEVFIHKFVVVGENVKAYFELNRRIPIVPLTYSANAAFSFVNQLNDLISMTFANQELGTKLLAEFDKEVRALSARLLAEASKKRTTPKQP
jgi:hypothetical protein